MGTGNRLMDARCRLVTRLPWYGTIAQQFNWIQTESLPTMGVSITQGGRVNCYYNPNFCAELTIIQMAAVIRHEIEHIVLLHCLRGRSKKKDMFNIACDMIINGKEDSPQIPNLPDGKHKGVYYMQDWKWGMTAEEVYAKLDDYKVIANYKGGEANAENGGWTKEMGNPNGSKTVEINIEEGFDEHSTWEESTASEEEARQRIKEMCRRASQAAGSTPGHMVDAIAKLDNPVISWCYVLKQVMGRVLGGKRKTWSKVNRRNPVFGSKGKSSHARVPITIAVDTSGSMDMKRLEMAFTEIEGAAHKTKITLVQFDHGYQCHDRYRKGDWSTIEIKGRGGTCFGKIFAAMQDKSLIGRLNVIVTDGEAPWPDEPNWPILWVILNSKERITPPFGNVVYIE